MNIICNKPTVTVCLLNQLQKKNTFLKKHFISVGKGLKFLFLE